MRFWKSLIVVLVSLSVSSAARSLMIQIYSYEHILITLLLGFSFVLLPGIVAWFLHSYMAHFISKLLFKTEGKFKDVLYGFGIAHFPYMIGSLSALLIFFGAIGFFAFLFFSMFFSLLVYFLFLEAIVAFHGLSWRRGFAVLVLSSIIVAVIFAIPPLLFNTSLYPQTSIVTEFTQITGSFIG